VALGLQAKRLQVASGERSFLVQPPTDASRAAPVLLVLHGGTQSMRRLLQRGAGASLAWPGLARRENALLLIPNGTSLEHGEPHGDRQTWNDLRSAGGPTKRPDDVAFLTALIDWAHATYRTDRRKVFVTGASNGGIMTFRLLMEAPDRFTAAAAFIAALPEGETGLRQPSRVTPLLIVNGTEDRLIKWSGGNVMGGRGRTRSVEATVAWWRHANRTDDERRAAIETLPDVAPNDGCQLERIVYPARPGGAEVQFIRMVGGGHTMPSQAHPLEVGFLARQLLGTECRDVETAELVWDFFKRHAR
jgi:polyhydroxybutyrate depolymerase